MPDDLKLDDLIASLGAGAQESIRALSAGLAELSRAPEVALLRRALNSAAAAGAAATGLSPRQANELLAELKSAADRLRREGVDPALGLAALVGDCLDGLAVLVATDAVPLPAELAELRRALARLRRPELRLDLALPADDASPALAGQLVRTLVAGGPDLDEGPAALAELTEAVRHAVAGAVERTRAHDPSRPVEAHARLRGDLLLLEVVDRGAGDVAAPAEGGWNLALVRRVADEVAYESGAGGSGGVLRLRKVLRSWRWR